MNYDDDEFKKVQVIANDLFTVLTDHHADFRQGTFALALALVSSCLIEGQTKTNTLRKLDHMWDRLAEHKKENPVSWREGRH
jgi:hypothetical protein